jgi:predicted dinucleotide-utilizing enzyme
MDKQRIAIIGLGRIGTAFLREMLGKNSQGIDLVCAAETSQTEGKAQAIAAGVKLLVIDEIIALGKGIDVIFDLTGRAEVRKNLREALAASDNRHTVIASESILRVIWSLIGAESLPVVEGRNIGY